MRPEGAHVSTTQVCTQCGKRKPLSEYHRNGDQGLRSNCKVCQRAKVVGYYRPGRKRCPTCGRLPYKPKRSAHD
jgi:hypothetical protein